MRYCPQCRAEYRDGIDRCSDCDVVLVDELGPEPELDWDPTEWVTVEEVGEPATAAILEGFLLEQGFPVRVLNQKDRELVTTLGELSTIEVQVPASELDRALAVLIERDEAAEDEEPDDEI